MYIPAIVIIIIVACFVDFDTILMIAGIALVGFIGRWIGKLLLIGLVILFS